MKKWIAANKTDLLIACSLALTSFILYAATVAPTVLTADSGEFQFAPYVLGLAHPTGYPLYLLLGWAWSHALPVGDVAYRLNVFSAVWAAVTVGLLYPALLSFLEIAAPAVSGRRLAAVLGAVTFGVSQTFWSQAVIAEVYSMNAFFVALLFPILLNWAGAYSRGEDSRRWWYAFCLTYGLGLSHHRLVALLFPAVVVFVWPTVARDEAIAAPGRLRRFAVRGGVSLLLVLLPMLLYLYVPLRAPYSPYTVIGLGEKRQLVTYENSLQGFAGYFLGQMFQEELGGWQQGFSRLPLIWDLLRAQFGLAGITLGLVGLGRLLATRRWKLFLLTFLSYLAVVVFNAIYQIGDIFVFFIPSYLVFSLWLALGALTLAQGVSVLLERRPLLGSAGLYAGAVVLALLFTLPLGLLLQNLPVVDRHDDFVARDAWQAILAQPLPTGAVLASNDRDDMMPMWYYQYVEGRRPDLVGLFPDIVDDAGFSNVGGVVDSALDSGLPVFLVKKMPGLDIKYRMEQEGAVVRVLGTAVEKPPTRSRDIVLSDTVRLLGYDQSPHSLRPGQELQVNLYWQAQRRLQKNFVSYVHLVDEAGNGITQSDHVPGEVYYPTSLWRPGETLRDNHLLTLPQGLPPGNYRLLVGMYDSESHEPLGQATFAGQVAVKAEVTTAPGKIERPVQANFDSLIYLLGYGLKQSDDGLSLTLYWQAERATDLDYTMFVHLVDQEGKIVTQQDGQPRQGAYPTSVWDEGEVISDTQTLSLSPQLQAGRYRLVTGWYLLETGKRLSVLDDQGRAIGDQVVLGQVEWPGSG